MKRTKTALVLASILAIHGCGGGGSDSDGSDAELPKSGPTAEGVYGGTLTGGAADSFQLVVLENDEYWALYGDTLPSVFLVSGFIQGTGKSNNGSFTSSNPKDFGVIPAVSGTLTATYDATAKTISGEVKNSLGAVGFQGGPIPNSLYDYKSPADLSKITGIWMMTDLSGEGLTLDIAANGAFTGTTTTGCSMSGSFVPRPSGKNVFNVSLTFGSAPCGLPGQTATGIGIEYPLTSGRTQLIAAVKDSARDLGTAAFGSR